MPKRKSDPIVQSFATRLRELRREKGMSQSDLAALVHTTESYLSRLENAQITPGIDLAARLARALACPVSELLPTEPPPNTTKVLEDQAKRLFENVLRAKDQSLLTQLNQFLALLAEAAQRR